MTFYVFQRNGHILEAGDEIHVAGKPIQIFQTCLHPRKVYTMQQDGQKNSYYASVLNVGIWDNKYNEWSFTPSWDLANQPDILNTLLNEVDIQDEPDNSTPKVIYRKDLRGLDKDGRECEQCSKPMHEHEWALLDINGFVLHCPYQSR